MHEPGSPGTVLIIDDDPAVRDSLCELVASAGLGPVTFKSGCDFLERYDGRRPACILLDMCMPGISGLELQEQLRARQLDLPVLVLTGHADVPMATRSFKLGAVEFIEKPFNDDLLLNCVREHLEGDALRCRYRKWEEEIAERLARLSTREQQVLELVVNGYANKQIAAHLGITQRTVEVHRAHVMRKMQAGSVSELVRLVLSGPDGQRKTVVGCRPAVEGTMAAPA